MSTISAEQLQLHIEAIEHLEAEKKSTSDDIKSRYDVAKAEGFDPKTMKAIVKLRAMEKEARQEAEALLSMYRSALALD